ncbi:MAG: DUF6055 domain-containing protein [Kiritimatiellia bacterium]|jgi:hypothetical protein|nr:DUF6055 domain-containing protein [Kiritimatiellia bacterium]
MNYRQLILIMTLLGLVGQGVIAGESKIDKKLAREAPLFERAKMRGRVLDEVSRDVIKQTSGEGYQLRVVEWWPKKGVDFVEEPEGKPRTWTIREAESSKEMKWWPRALRGKTQFKAHLLGFRGIGSAQNPWADDVTTPLTPAVVLRLPDGRKRCFTRGCFSDKDEQYIVDLYEKQMKVLRDNTFEEGFERVAASHNMGEKISDNPLYTPGTTHISSKHYTATLGSEPPDDGGGSRWLIADDKERAALNRKLIMQGWEDWWAYLEHGGHLMFFSEKLGPKYKYRFLVGGTKKDGKTLGRGFGGGYGACSGGDGWWAGLYHEWGHGIPTANQMTLGGGETMCDTGQIIGDPNNAHKCMFQVIKPWKNLFWGWYPGAYAWSVIGDDPNWGYVFPYAIARMMSDKESSPMHVIARVGEERGIFKDGIRETGDLLGQVGARFAEFDNELEMGLRGVFGLPTRVNLLEVDREKRRYRCDPKWSPEAFGVNMVRLVPDKGAKKLTVDFQGHYDAKVYSDWRACIVAVDRDGKCRYSPLWNKGTMTLKTQPGDLRYWLTVTATPTALSPTEGRGLYQAVHVVYQGGFGYRYPYDVTLKGCRAGSPHSTPIDDGTDGQSGLKSGRNPGEGCNSASIPVTDPEQRQQAEEVLAAMGDDQRMAGRWAKAAEWHLKNMKGKHHPNGGGWVADTATVADTAYVGPNAMVLDEAKVLDDAVIEDSVIVYGNAIFKDSARAYGKLAVEKGVFSKDARMYIRNEPKWSTQKVTISPDSDAPQKRYAQLMKAPPLQANFDIVQPESSLLEDHFNERSGTIYGSHRDDRIFFDGVLIGNPGFTYDGVESGAVTFNGKDQWAEMPGELADLETITVDVRFMVDSTKQQTVWMFGNDASSQLSLSVADGKLVLLGQGGGKHADCRGGKVVSEQWTTVRVELDGKTMKLFQDGKNIGEVKADFRASDAFTPGKVRMATLGAGFGGATPMAGAVDHLRFFTEVLDDFEAADIPMVNPRHLCPRFLARFEARYPDFHAKRTHFRWSGHPLYLYYKKYNKGLGYRTEVLAKMAGDSVAGMENRIASLKQRRHEIDQEMREARKNDQSHKEREQQLRPQMHELHKKRDAIMMANAEYRETRKRDETLRREIQEFRNKAEEELKKTPAYSKLLENITTLQKAVNAMKPGSAEREKEQKRLQELHGKRNRMVEDRQWASPEAAKLRRDREGRRGKNEQLRRTIQETSEWKEVDKKYRELEKQIRYQPDPKFAREQKQIDQQVQKMEQALKLLHVSAAAEANPLEAQLIQTSIRPAFAYHHTIAHTVLLGMLPAAPDDVGQLNKAKALQSRPWPSTADWDRLAPYEKDKEVIAQPVMQHYLKRMKPWMYE